MDQEVQRAIAELRRQTLSLNKEQRVNLAELISKSNFDDLAGVDINNIFLTAIPDVQIQTKQVENKARGPTRAGGNHKYVFKDVKKVNQEMETESDNKITKITPSEAGKRRRNNRRRKERDSPFSSLDTAQIMQVKNQFCSFLLSSSNVDNDSDEILEEESEEGEEDEEESEEEEEEKFSVKMLGEFQDSKGAMDSPFSSLEFIDDGENDDDNNDEKKVKPNLNTNSLLLLLQSRKMPEIEISRKQFDDDEQKTNDSPSPSSSLEFIEDILSSDSHNPHHDDNTIINVEKTHIIADDVNQNATKASHHAQIGKVNSPKLRFISKSRPANTSPSPSSSSIPNTQKINNVPSSSSSSFQHVNQPKPQISNNNSNSNNAVPPMGTAPQTTQLLQGNMRGASPTPSPTKQFTGFKSGSNSPLRTKLITSRNTKLENRSTPLGCNVDVTDDDLEFDES